MKKLLIVFMLLLPNALIKPAAAVKKAGTVLLKGGACGGLFGGAIICAANALEQHKEQNFLSAAFFGMHSAFFLKHFSPVLPVLGKNFRRRSPIPFLVFNGGFLIGLGTVITCYDNLTRNHK